MGGIGILGTIATGTLSDWLGRRNVLLIMFGARGITALFVVVAPGPESLIAFVVVFGLLGYGAIGVIGALASELFGRKAIGAILGSAYVFNQQGARLECLLAELRSQSPATTAPRSGWPFSRQLDRSCAYC